MPAPGFVHPEFLIDTASLERRLDEPGLRILDCTTHLIPGGEASPVAPMT
jgi:hypothetical protein